jgi:hypothetical protein
LQVFLNTISAIAQPSITWLTTPSINLTLFEILSRCVNDLRTLSLLEQSNDLKMSVNRIEAQMLLMGQVRPESDEFTRILGYVDGEDRPIYASAGFENLIRRSLDESDQLLFEKTLKLLETVPNLDSNVHAYCLSRLVQFLAERNRIDETPDYVDRAERLIINNKYANERAFVELCTAYASLGEVRKSRECLKFVRDENIKIYALTRILFEIEMKSTFGLRNAFSHSSITPS